MTPATRASLRADLEMLGLAAGDDVFVHAALRSLGPIIGGPDTITDALCDAVGPQGTILGYTDCYTDEIDIDAEPTMLEHIPPFDPQRTRSVRDNGAFPELLRTTPGARRSGTPGASCAALGAKADWFTADHALDYGYGPQSPFGKLVEAGGKVLMLGAPRDTMTLLHHAEHLADIKGKRVIRYRLPILTHGQKVWREFEEFDTANPVVDGLPDDFFATIVTDYLATGEGRTGRVGQAECVLVDAAPMVRFGVDWLESRFG